MRRLTVVLAIALFALGTFAAIAASGVKTKTDANHVTICHATGSSTNPYVQISPSASGVFHGHLGKSHQDGRDIIPPFVYKGVTYSQNWDATGQAIWNNGCKPVGSATTTTPPTTTTTPTTTATTTTTKTVTVSKTVTVPKTVVKKVVVTKKVYLPKPPKRTTVKPHAFPWTP